MSSIPKIFKDPNPGEFPKRQIQKECNHNTTSQLVLHNHPNKQSLVVCKMCFRTVVKENELRRNCSTSVGKKRHKRQFRNIRLLQNATNDQRPINTARDTLRSRNKLRPGYKTD